MTRSDALQAAVELAAALAGPEEELRALLSRVAEEGAGPLQAAAELIERAAADPIGVSAELGEQTARKLRVGERGIDRLHRILRRDHALGALYAVDQIGGVLDLEGLSPQAADLAETVWAARGELDPAIGEAAEGWRVSRMAPVDRNVLRLGLWELRHRPETPVAVIVSEAVRLAKTYSTGQSGRFVNGVLAGLAAAERPGDRTSP